MSKLLLIQNVQTPVNSECPKVENFVYLTGLNQTPVNSECPKVENLCWFNWLKPNSCQFRMSKGRKSLLM
jgi:hypothetical protein